jgi:endonuclease/exonuclease/phosphatase family metal-dependent hydrolase
VAEPARGSEQLRVLTYNVRDLKDDLAAVVRVVRALDQDVACLQEVPRWFLGGHRVGALADAARMLWSGGAESTGGTAVFTSLRIDQRMSGAGRLPVSGWLTRRRGYAAAVVGVPGGPPVTVASVHLSLDPEERRRHARLVLDALRSFGPAPYVVAGDLNEAPHGPAWEALGELVGDPVGVGAGTAAATFPARSPRQRIDAVLVSSGLLVESVRVPGPEEGVDPVDLAVASDHLPVVADVRVTDVQDRLE